MKCRAALLCVVLAVSAVLPAAVLAPVVAHASATGPVSAGTFCARWYVCRNVRAQVCVVRPPGGNDNLLTKKDIRIRTGNSVDGCSWWAVGFHFLYRYNHRNAALLPRAPFCSVEAEHREAKIAVNRCRAGTVRDHGRFASLWVNARLVEDVGTRSCRACGATGSVVMVGNQNGRLQVQVDLPPVSRYAYSLLRHRS